MTPTARLTVTEIRTEQAALALVELYGAASAEFVAAVLSAEWMTEAERKSFAPLAEALRVYADAP